MEDKKEELFKAIDLLSPSQFIYFLVIPVSSPSALLCSHTGQLVSSQGLSKKNINLMKGYLSLVTSSNSEPACTSWAMLDDYVKEKTPCVLLFFCFLFFSILYPETISYYYSFKENLVAAPGEINEQNKTCNQPFFIY